MAPHKYSIESLRDILWDPEVIKTVYPKCPDDDIEILKASLMLQSVLVLFKEMRKKQNRFSVSMQTLSKDLQEALAVKRSLELKVEHLEVKCDRLCFKVEDAESRANLASAELKRLQEQLAQKVDERAQSIFLSCLKRNRGATVLDWMTQLNQESQVITGEDKSKTINETSDSPDLICATPESNKTVFKKGKKKLRICESMENCINAQTCIELPQSKKSDLTSVTPVSKKMTDLSSPDEIADTPIAYNVRNFAETGIGTNQLGKLSFATVIKENCKQNLVLSLDTQELETEPMKPLNSEFFAIPETFHPENFEADLDSYCEALESQKRRKESSCSATPKKSPKPHDDASPILGSTSKLLPRKGSQSPALSESLSPSLIGDHRPSFKNSAASKKNDKAPRRCLGLDKYNFAIEKESRLHGGKKYRQQKLSLSSYKRSRDISQHKEFNGEQRPTELKNLDDINQLPEEDQIKLALQASLLDCPEVSDTKAMNDTDETIFEVQGMDKDNSQNQNQDGESKRINAGVSNSVNDSFFQPMFASTAKFPSPKKPSTFALFSKPTTSKDQPIKICNPPLKDQIQFNPLCTSTEKAATENSELLDLVELINAGDVVAPRETSFDRLPRKESPSPPYKYKGKAVRKKTERMKLKGRDCPDCRQFNQHAGFEVDDPRTEHLLQKCSRHRSKHMRRPSPEGFWNPDFPPTPKPKNHQS